jgi:hypothetical protein
MDPMNPDMNPMDESRPSPPNEKSGVLRDKPTKIDPAREAHVSELLAAVDSAKKYYAPRFKQMTDDAKFARGKQWDGDYVDDQEDRYVANITQRHIQQRVATLYAKNPKFQAKPQERIETRIWDGTAESVQQAVQQMAAGAESGMPPNPMQMMMIQEYEQERQRRSMYRNIARTMELVVKHYVSEQVYPFKRQMKRLVRRALIMGVGYLKLDYQRVMEMRPGAERQLADMTERLASIERMSRDMQDGEITIDEAEADRLRSMISAFEQEAQVLIREGLVFEFPDSRRIIPDERCVSLDGFIGCEWVAEEYYLSPEEVQEIYKVDVSSSAKGYTKSSSGSYTENRNDEGELEGSVRVIEVYHKKDGLVYPICDGWPDFLMEPYTPNVYLERFWPYFTLMFTDLEPAETKDIFPMSDVSLMRHQQQEYNRSREGLREHRVHNRPGFAAPAGVLESDDRSKLSNRTAHDVVELQGLQPGQRIEDVLQSLRGNPIDPNLYEVSPVFQDVLRVVGTQEANLGGTSGSTATESAIAEGSRATSTESAIDDLNDFLGELARCMGQVLFQELSEQTVKRIVGQGAVWPQLERTEIAEELVLEIEAGSTGRPNRVQDLDNLTRVAPYLIQIPGIKPEWLAKQVLNRLDDNLDVADGVQTGLPSITALNQSPRPGTGNPATEPTQQGGQGMNNAPRQEDQSSGQRGRPPMSPVRTTDQANNAIRSLPG